MALSRRALLRGALALPLLAACDTRPLYGIPSPTATGGAEPRRLLLWHADAVPGERVLARELLPGFTRLHPAIEVSSLAHGDLDDLARRVGAASAGGVGPDLFQAPGEWLPDLVARRLVAPLEREAARLTEPTGWAPRLAETAQWQGRAWGVPASVYVRQPFFNELLLRDAGLFNQGRTTPPTTWAELADVSKRVLGPENRWGSLLPSHNGDEELYLHVLQHVHTAGGDLPRRDGNRLALDSPAMRETLTYLLDLVQRNGALPLDRQSFRLPETGKAGLWWTDGSWIGTQAAVGATLRVGAVPVPRNRRGGAIVRGRHWSLAADGGSRDEAATMLGYLAQDDTSHAYCAALSLPPARRANWGRATYTVPSDKTRPHEPAVWRAVIEQLGSPDNLALTTFPGYREVAGRIGGEFQLVLLGRKPIENALGEGEGAAAELLARS